MKCGWRTHQALHDFTTSLLPTVAAAVGLPCHFFSQLCESESSGRQEMQWGSSQEDYGDAPMSRLDAFYTAPDSSPLLPHVDRGLLTVTMSHSSTPLMFSLQKPSWIPQQADAASAASTVERQEETDGKVHPEIIVLVGHTLEVASGMAEVQVDIRLTPC